MLYIRPTIAQQKLCVIDECFLASTLGTNDCLTLSEKILFYAGTVKMFINLNMPFLKSSSISSHLAIKYVGPSATF